MTAERPRNVLLITCDQWRGDALGAAGNPIVKTPAFDRLAAEGTRFANHFSVTSPCGPARASLLTGTYARTHRSVRNGIPLDHRFTNLALEARAVGYRPILFGFTDTTLDPRHFAEAEVMRLGEEGELPGFDIGVSLNLKTLDSWRQHLSARGKQIDGETASLLTPADGRIGAPAGHDEASSQTAFLTEQAIDYIAGAADGWFVHLSYLRPHPPFVAPAPYHALYDPADMPAPVRAPTRAAEAAVHPWLGHEIERINRQMNGLSNAVGEGEDYERHRNQHVATYYGLITKLDHWIGRLLDALREQGRYDDTLIIITSDHGELAGDHWLFGKSGWFDKSYHVPLIVRDPSAPAASRGSAVTAFTESIDVMPTILDWLGRVPPRQCEGVSLVPWLQGERPEDWRDEVHIQYDFRDTGRADAPRPLGLDLDHCALDVVRTERYKYVHFAGLPALLFDLVDDPGELENRFADPGYQSTRMDMMDRMLTWRLCTDDRLLTGIRVSRHGIGTFA